MVFDGLLVGGITKVGLDYYRLLKDMGHDITIVNLRPNNCTQEEFFDTKIIHFNYPRNLAPEKYSRLEKMYSFGRFVYPLAYTALRVVNLVYSAFYKVFIDFTKYDLIIAFSSHYNDLSFVAYGFARNSNKLAWVHGALFEYVLNSEGFLRLHKKINNLIVLSDSNQIVLDTCNKYLRLSIYKLYNPTLIANKPIDENKVHQLKEKYGDYCLMVSRISKDKDHITAIRAMKYYNEKYSDNKKLVFVGDGELRRDIEKYVSDNKLEDTVFFEGSRNDVQNYYRSAFMFIHSSPLEGLPTTLIEALYLGLPIVSTNSLPGVGEVLDGGKYGLVSPVGDYQALGDNIYKLYTDKNTYNSLVSKGYERAKEFNPSNIAPRLHEIIEEIGNKHVG